MVITIERRAHGAAPKTEGPFLGHAGGAGERGILFQVVKRLAGPQIEIQLVAVELNAVFFRIGFAHVRFARVGHVEPDRVAAVGMKQRNVAVGVVLIGPAVRVRQRKVRADDIRGLETHRAVIDRLFVYQRHLHHGAQDIAQAIIGIGDLSACDVNDLAVLCVGNFQSKTGVVRRKPHFRVIGSLHNDYAGCAVVVVDDFDR